MSDKNYQASLDTFLAYMNDFVAAAKQAAQDASKPLLIIFGEDHTAETDLIIQSMLLKACANQCVPNYYVEYDQERLRLSNTIPFEDRVRNTDFVAPMAERGLGMNVGAIDKTIDISCRKSLVHACTPQGMIERDDHMIGELIDKNDHGFLQVGFLHLRSFSCSDALSQQYHIVPVIHSGLLQNEVFQNKLVLDCLSETPSISERVAFPQAHTVMQITVPDELRYITKTTLFNYLLGERFAPFACAKNAVSAAPERNFAFANGKYPARPAGQILQSTTNDHFNA